MLRLVLTLDGETVTELRPVIGYLHTGIEKNMEFRTWTQGVTFCTRMDYLSPLFNETAYCLAVERLLGITDEIPERASVMRVLMMELNRISSHLVALGTFGLEIGATTVFLYGFRERERVLDLFELITGLADESRVRPPGRGAAAGPAPGCARQIREFLGGDAGAGSARCARCSTPTRLLPGPDQGRRLPGPGRLHGARRHRADAAGTGLPGTCARASRTAATRPTSSTCPTQDTCDAYGRYLVRMDEMDESLRIIEQCPDRLAGPRPPDDPVMIADTKIGWPARLALGPDGLGNSPDHIAHIMGQSMEALIHHFKLVTEGFRVPPGQVYVAVESPRGELAATWSATAVPGRTGPLPRPVVHQPAVPAGDVRGRSWSPTSSRRWPASTR